MIEMMREWMTDGLYTKVANMPDLFIVSADRLGFKAPVNGHARHEIYFLN